MLTGFSVRNLLSLILMMAATAVWGQPTLSVSFMPDTIGPGSSSMAVFTIQNPTPTPVTDLAFTGTLPAGVAISTPALAKSSCTLGANLTAPNGGSTVTFSGAQLGVNQSCEITVIITSSTLGVHTNPAITLTSSAGSSTSQAVDLTVAADRPGFSKSFSPAVVSFGQRSRLTFTIDNTSNTSPVPNLDFVDNLPVGLEIADPANLLTNCGNPVVGDPTISAFPGNKQITFDANGTISFPAIAAGATCQVELDVLAETVASVDNQSNDLLADFIATGFAVATLEVNSTALALVKEFENDPVQPGDTLNLAFTLHNFNRNFNATGITFNDDLNATLSGLIFNGVVFNDCGGTVGGVGTGLMNFGGGTLAPDASCTLRIAVAVPAGAVPGDYSNTTSAISGTVDGAPVNGNSASDELFINYDPVFTKEFIDDPVGSGGQVTLRFTITNTNPNAGLTNINFSDNIGGVNFPLGGAIPGMAANSLVDPNGQDPAPLIDPCGSGSELTVSDPLPNFIPPDPTLLEFSGGQLTPAGSAGDSCTFDVVLDVPAGVNTGTYTNVTSFLNSDAGESPPATDDISVVGGPQLQMNFIDDPVAPGDGVILQFNLSHSAEAANDASNISFTSDLSAVLSGLTATLPVMPDPPCGAGSTLTGSAGDTFLTFSSGQLAPGGSCDFAVTLAVPAAASQGSYTTSTSLVSAMTGGFSTQSNAAVDTLDISGLRFSKEFLDDPVIPGASSTLRFSIENIHSTEAATVISFIDDLAAVLPGTPDLSAQSPPIVDTCNGTMSGTTFLSYTGGSVNAGSGCTIEVVVDVPVGVADGTYQNNTSSLSATQGAAVVTPPAIDSLTVNARRIGLSKLFSNTPVAAGDNVNLEFTLTNLDLVNPISNLAFSDDLDASLSGLTAAFLPMSACGGTVAANPNAGVIDFSGGSLAAGGSCSFTVTLNVPAAVQPGIYTNTTSQVVGLINGLFVNGSPATDQLEIVNLVQFSHAFDGATVPGDTAVLSFAIANNSNINNTNLSFTTDLNATLSGLVAIGLPQSNLCGIGSQFSGTSLLTFSGGQLASGESCNFSVTVLVPALASPGNYTNATSDLLDSGLLVSLGSTASLQVEPPPQPPMFSKSFSPNLIGVNQITTLTFMIDNAVSTSAAVNLDFTDNMPAGLVVATPANASTTCVGGSLSASSGNGTVSYTGGQVAAGTSCVVQTDVTAVNPGSFFNVSSDLLSSAGNSGTASASLAVTSGLSLAKAFIGASSTYPGDDIQMQFTLTNPTAMTIDSISFSDDLHAFIPASVAINTPLSGVCGVGSSLSGTGIISLTDGVLAPGAVCQFTVLVNIPSNTGFNEYTNTTSEVTANINGLPWNGGAASVGSANLSVVSRGVVVPVPGLFGPWTWLLILGVLALSLLFLKQALIRQQH